MARSIDEGNLPASRVEQGRPAAGGDGVHFTFCRICEAYCGLRAEVKDGRITTLAPDRDNPHSRGHVCVKGTSFLDIVYDRDRVLHPLRRDAQTDTFVEVTWEEALDDIADRLAAILRRDGPDAVANYNGNPNAFSTGATLSIRPFFTHFGVTKMFAAATQDASARMMASYILYGSALRLPIPDLARCDFLIAIGANMLVSHGSLLTAPRLREDLDAVAKRGRVLIIDPRKTETAKRYEHLFVRPDSDAWFLAAMLRTIFEEELQDVALLNERTTGWQTLREAVNPITAEIASVHCGVEANCIRSLARDFAATPRAAIYGRTGTCRGNHSTLVNLFICALNIVTGKFGVEGGWVFGDAAIDMAATRPGGHEIRQTRFGPRSCIGKNLHFSLLTDEILEPGEGQVRALFVEAGNIVLSAPGSDRTIEALRALDLFVAIDLYVTETSRHADYILPATTFVEREDVPLFGFPHMIRPFAQYTDAVVQPLGQAREEHLVFGALAQALHNRLVSDPGRSRYGASAAPAWGPLETIDALLAKSDFAKAGVLPDLTALKRYPHGIQLASGLLCSNSWSKSLHADGRVHLWHDMLDAEMERLTSTIPPADGELRLFSQRDLRSINSWMHNSDRLVRSQEPALMMNPADAVFRSIADGQDVRLVSRAGSIVVPVKLTDEVMEGSVCYPHGWGHRGGWARANATLGANVNRIADASAGESLSASSLLDGIPVSVAPISRR